MGPFISVLIGPRFNSYILTGIKNKHCFKFFTDHILFGWSG